MRSLKLWTCVVHLTLLCLVSDRVTAAPALTTIQDTLYKADGTRFNGVAYIEWNSFQASDSSAIATSSVVVPIIEGMLRVRLVPTSNASAGAHYLVRYHSDGKVQFTETWNVIPSLTPVALAADPRRQWRRHRRRHYSAGVSHHWRNYRARGRTRRAPAERIRVLYGAYCQNRHNRALESVQGP